MGEDQLPQQVAVLGHDPDVAIGDQQHDRAGAFRVPVDHPQVAPPAFGLEVKYVTAPGATNVQGPRASAHVRE